MNERRQTDEARRAYAASVAEGEALVKEHPDVVSYRWNLAVHLSGLMTLESGRRALGAAEAPARRALELAEGISAKVPAGRLPGRSPPTAGLSWRICCQIPAARPKRTPCTSGPSPSTRRWCRECPEVPEYRHSLTQLLTRVGDRRRNAGSFAEAQSAYDRSLPLAEGLARDFPEVPTYRLGPIAVRTSLAKLAVNRRRAGQSTRVAGAIAPAAGGRTEDQPR